MARRFPSLVELFGVRYRPTAKGEPGYAARHWVPEDVKRITKHTGWISKRQADKAAFSTRTGISVSSLEHRGIILHASPEKYASGAARRQAHKQHVTRLGKRKTTLFNKFDRFENELKLGSGLGEAKRRSGMTESEYRFYKRSQRAGVSPWRRDEVTGRLVYRGLP